MAVEIHVARIGERKVSSAGQVFDKNEATIKEVLEATTEDRVLEDSAISSTSGNPTIKQYLELEAANDFVLRHLDQNMIVTYKT